MELPEFKVKAVKHDQVMIKFKDQSLKGDGSFDRYLASYLDNFSGMMMTEATIEQIKGSISMALNKAFECGYLYCTVKDGIKEWTFQDETS